ncbi:hypothetical protein C1646_755792 [Rhizophagus diaphanus]|nr:hypothetical protein C1646_755792 [Rhizophagus diaphanus] [Rhizophagus sp. MUCL 43196]
MITITKWRLMMKVKINNNEMINDNEMEINEINDEVEINDSKMEINDDEVKINDNTTNINDDKVEINSRKVATNTRRQKLMKIIKGLPDNQLKSAVHLLSIMRYSKGPNEKKLESKFQSNTLSEFFTFGIMLDDSTRGQHKICTVCYILKDLATCTGISVAQAIYDIFDHFKVNSEQCFVCISDNSNYMSGKSSGVISLFNKQSGVNLF